MLGVCLTFVAEIVRARFFGFACRCRCASLLFSLRHSRVHSSEPSFVVLLQLSSPSAMSDTFLFTSESVNEGHPGTRQGGTMRGLLSWPAALRQCARACSSLSLRFSLAPRLCSHSPPCCVVCFPRAQIRFAIRCLMRSWTRASRTTPTPRSRAVRTRTNTPTRKRMITHEKTCRQQGESEERRRNNRSSRHSRPAQFAVGGTRGACSLSLLAWAFLSRCCFSFA